MNTSAIAQNLASRGRGEDKMLVHMTPNEVEGLQALAMAQGGSLTINPETGLLEAGFLSNTFKALAPTLIGAGLAYFGGMPAWAAGLTVGGVEAVRKDDLGAGIMAGLGAYGGAGMAQGLAGMGAGTAGAAGAGTQTLANVGTPAVGASAGAAGTVGGAGSVFPGMQGGVNPAFRPAITGSAGAGAAGTTNSLVGSGAQIPGIQSASPLQPISTQQVPGVNIEERVLDSSTFDRSRNMYNGQVGDAYTADSMAKTAAERATKGLPEYAPSFRQNVGTGVDRLGQPGGFTALKDNYITAMGGNKQALLGLAGVGASVADGYGAFDPKPFDIAKAETDDYGGPYEPTPRTARFQSTDDILAGRGREFRYFDDVNPYPNVRPIQAAEGGLMALDAADEGRFLEGQGDGVSDCD